MEQMNLASLFSTAHQTYSRERAAELSCAARASHFPLTFGPSMGLTLTSRGRYAVQIVPDDLSAESNHCAAGAARTAKLARRAQGRMPGVKAIAPDTRRCDGAASVPCASRSRRAGPNSHIHVLKHTGLSPAARCDARLPLRRKSQRPKSIEPSESGEAKSFFMAPALLLSIYRL